MKLRKFPGKRMVGKEKGISEEVKAKRNKEVKEINNE